MIVRPKDLELGPRRWAGSVAAPDPAPGAGIDLRGPIAFGLEVEDLGGRLKVSGWLHAIPRIDCSRCLLPTSVIVRREYDLTFESTEAIATEEEVELDEADLDIDYYPGDGIDLRPILAEQVLLDLPVKPLCGEACKGLCAQCGTNLNEEGCDCEAPVDPRLSALGELRDQL
ncbi:MAG: DUF177 domain-containing protein [Acidobacteria bacterium]|nr:DUF177 domain-containing protein [Acidobacteriota bacterium]